MGVEAPKEGQYHYQSYTLGSRPIASVIERVYANFSALPEGSWVLDLGSGPGRLAINAPKPRPFRFLGIDQSYIAIEQFRQAVSRDGRMDEAIVGDITDLHLPQGRDFRGAISWRVLHALNPKQQIQTLDQVRKILPTGASFFLAVASDSDWKASELKMRGTYVSDGPNECAEVMVLSESFHIDFFNPEKLERLASETGFIIFELKDFQEPTGFDHLRERHPLNNYLYAHLVRM